MTPDRLSEKVAVNLPFGAIEASIAANGYNDDLPGALLAQRTHFWTETLNLSTLENGTLVLRDARSRTLATLSSPKSLALEAFVNRRVKLGGTLSKASGTFHLDVTSVLRASEP